jgi:hypothetical protein
MSHLGTFTLLEIECLCAEGGVSNVAEGDVWAAHPT